MKTKTLLTLAIAVTCGGAAMAQKAGSWSVSAGFTQIAPDVKSGNLSAPRSLGRRSLNVGAPSDALMR